jgi:hypothetical protein
MADMTDEEYDALDEYFTKNPPKVDPSKARYIAPRGEQTVTLDDFSADYINSRAEAAHKTPAEIITDLVREKLAKTADFSHAGK